MKKILQYYLKYITKLVLAMHRPTIIAITGSTNKTFVKNEINKVLRELFYSPQKSPSPSYRSGEAGQPTFTEEGNSKSFNTEIGLPLAILNLSSGYNSYKNWLPIIPKAALKLFQFNFPKFLVLELGVSDPGDMKYLLTIIKPKIAVITDITQRYLESFDDMNDLVEEYEYLVKKTNKNGLVILNYDNPRIKKLAKINKIPVEYFGFNDGAHWQAIKIKREDPTSLHPSLRLRTTRKLRVASRGQSVKISHNNIINQHKINRFGQHHIYALLIGLIVKDYICQK